MKRVWVLWLVACSGSGSGSAIDAALPRVDAFPPRADAAPVIDARFPIDARIPDAAVDASPLQLECAALRQRYTALVTGLSQMCNAPGDCRVLGKNMKASCDAFPMLATRCDGDAVSQTAYAGVAAELDPIVAEFESKCVVSGLCPASDLGCFPRCAAASQVSCTHNVCTPFTPVCSAN